MKRNVLILTALIVVVAGCEAWNTNRDEAAVPRSGILNESAGAQSQSSDVNPASSSRNVGQSGATTNQFDAPPAQPPSNEPQ